VLDPGSIQFGEPLFLWLQLLPAALVLLWVRHCLQRRRDARVFRLRHRAPIDEAISTAGPLPFWGCLIMALALILAALSQPRAVVRLTHTAGADIVVLQDGSASMYVRDVQPDRWQRSVRFLRVLAETLEWRSDRIALALFAHVATPQVRLTRDPNTFFFFLDHIRRESPFPLRDDTTWDTNIELGIHWGTRLVDKDEELNGSSPNGKALVLVSDGQAWSGEVADALQQARARRIPVHVVGVGTTYGGFIPQAPLEADGTAGVRRSASDRFSVLDRTSLQVLAREGGGQYFDLEGLGDRSVAASIVESARRHAARGAVEPGFDDLHGYCLAAAAALLGLSLLLTERSARWLILAGTGLSLGVLWALV
jgi:hypothetical protein